MQSNRQLNWLEKFIEKSIEDNLCLQINCTTCGAGSFRAKLSEVAIFNSEGSNAKKIQYAILDALKEVKRKEDGRWLDALRFIIFYLDRSLQSREALIHELSGTWAGSILNSMIEHYNNLSAAREERIKNSNPEAVALRRKLKKEARQKDHLLRLIKQKEKSRIWRKKGKN